MVTRNRAKLARRAIECFSRQTLRNTELVIVDDGDEDYSEVIAPYSKNHRISYHRLPPDAERTLGAARNVSLDVAEGDYCAQWDDDEWYHPKRLEVQMRAVATGFGAVVLDYTLMHLDSPGFVEHPYRATLTGGTPGTILHRKSRVRYPDLRKGEDDVYLASLREQMHVGPAPSPHSHLFIRCFHGDNTWDCDHFLERLRRKKADKWSHFWATKIRRNLFKHHAFRLTKIEKRTIEQFLVDSRRLDLICHA